MFGGLYIGCFRNTWFWNSFLLKVRGSGVSFLHVQWPVIPTYLVNNSSFLQRFEMPFLLNACHSVMQWIFLESLFCAMYCSDTFIDTF